MALTKIGKEGITGVSNSADATFLTATSGEGVTLAGTLNVDGAVTLDTTLAVTGVHTVGTNAVATSDGGAVTTSIVQGLCKAWTRVNMSTGASTDSLNISGLTDQGTGHFTVAINNNMGNANYSACDSADNVANNDNVSNQIESVAAGNYACLHAENGSATDTTIFSSSVFGDLA